MPKVPRVSVVIPAYNGSRYIRETVMSVLDQTFRDFELIVADDRSDDGTVEVLRSIDDPRLRIVENETNLGNGGTRNKLISLARGEYVAMLDHDDLCCPDRLATQVAYLDSHPEADVCSGRIDMIDADGNPTGKFGYDIFMDGAHVRTRTLLVCAVANVTLMFRREKFLDSGLCYETGGADDMSMYREGALKLNFNNIPHPLVKYRQWDGQFSTKLSASQLGHAMKSIVISNRKYGIELTEAEEKIISDSLGDIISPDNIPAWTRYAVRVLRAFDPSKGYDKKYLKKLLLARVKQNSTWAYGFREQPLAHLRYHLFKLRLRFL